MMPTLFSPKTILSVVWPCGGETGGVTDEGEETQTIG